jgi:hypothetical protein
MKGRLFISTLIVTLGFLALPAVAGSEFEEATVDGQHYRVTIAAGAPNENIAITCDGIGNFIEITRNVDITSMPSVQSVSVVLRLSDASFQVSANQRRVSDELTYFNGDIVEHKEFLRALLQSNTLEIMWDGANVKLNASDPLRQGFVRNCTEFLNLKLD